MPPRLRLTHIAATAACFTLFLFLATTVTQAGTKFDFHLVKHKEPGPTGQYPYVKPTPWPPLLHPPSPRNTTSSKPPPEKAVIVATLESQDISWIAKQNPDCETSIHVVENGFTRLHFDKQRIDRGRIANAYLRYIIDNYYQLPATMVFLCPARNSAASDFDVRTALQNLNTSFIQQTGFANLRCDDAATCLDPITPFRPPPDEFRTAEIAMPKAWEGLFNRTDVPDAIAAPCCSEFAVSKEQVRKRGVDAYQRYWEWLHKTGIDDETMGEVFEVLWHVIFGKDPVWCPEAERCECELYGRC